MILRRPDGTIVQPSAPLHRGRPCYTMSDLRQAVNPHLLWARKWYALYEDSRNDPLVNYYLWRRGVAIERLMAMKARKK